MCCKGAAQASRGKPLLGPHDLALGSECEAVSAAFHVHQGEISLWQMYVMRPIALAMGL